MASPNIGGSSNDATGDNLVRMAWLKKKKKLADEISRLCNDPDADQSTIDRLDLEFTNHLAARPW